MRSQTQNIASQIRGSFLANKWHYLTYYYHCFNGLLVEEKIEVQMSLVTSMGAIHSVSEKT